MADTLAVLQRVRALAVATAQRDLAERLAQQAAATARAEAAAAAIPAETTLAGDAALTIDFASWLPHGTAVRERMATEARLAATAAELARVALTAARTGERSVELLREHRAALAAKDAARRSQSALDEMAARRTGAA